MKISDALFNHIKDEVSRVRYGKVIIELNETANKVDVVTEYRKRFFKPDDEKKDEAKLSADNSK